MELKPEILDKLLEGVKTEDDLAGPDGLLKQILKRWWSGCWRAN